MTPLSTAPIILFPGIAADGRIFDHLRPYFPNLHTPAWVPLQKDEPLPAYTQRLLATIPLKFLQPPFYLGGHSFGGAIAQTAATLLSPAPTALFLISSFRHHRAISPLFKCIEFLTRPIPHRLCTLMVYPYRYIAPIIRRLEPVQLKSNVEMFYDTPLQITRWGARCATQFQLAAPPSIPIHQIHGSQDPLLPLRRATPDVTIPRGTHLIPLSHPKEIARFIAQYL